MHSSVDDIPVSYRDKHDFVKYPSALAKLPPTYSIYNHDEMLKPYCTRYINVNTTRINTTYTFQQILQCLILSLLCLSLSSDSFSAQKMEAFKPQRSFGLEKRSSHRARAAILAPRLHQFRRSP